MPTATRKAKILDISKKQYEIVYRNPVEPPRITQEDLAEVIELNRQKRFIDKALKEKRFMIRFGLEHGALIEPGARSVQLKKKMIVA